MGNCRLSGLYKQSIIVFLSTLPMGGATLHSLFYKIHHIISIHAPRGGSDVSCFTRQPPCSIFLSTLPVGGATQISSTLRFSIQFLSTLPVGGATLQKPAICAYIAISIHAPRGGSDMVTILQAHRGDVISIHAPRGGSDG